MPKKMAIVSSYNELCGNATYTEVLRKEFSKYYEVDVLALRVDLMASKNRELHKLASKHIKDLANRLKYYDYVNLQFEAGLYGHFRRDILKRVKILVNACKNLIFTMHRVDVPEALLDRGNLLSIFAGGFVGFLRQYRQRTYMAKLYPLIISHLKKRAKKFNIKVIVHTKREQRNIKDIFGFDQVYDFPITFLSEDMRNRERNDEEISDFKKRYMLERDAITIGLFGFISEYKGYETAVRALMFLPERYRILVFGTLHPMNIMLNTKVDKYIGSVIDLVEFEDDETDEDASSKYKILGRKKPKSRSSIKRDAYKKLSERVIFAGNLDDEKFIDALYCCDFAVLPYLETNQSGSGIASLVLESKIKALYSNNKSFFELKKYYPNSFETFDIGNHLELAFKIRNFTNDYSANIEKALEKYNLENNVLFQKSLFESGEV